MIPFPRIAQRRIPVEVVAGGGVFVDIIAQVNNGVQIGPFGNLLIGTEVARLVVTTRYHRKPKAICFVLRGGGAGAAGNRNLT